MDPAKLAWVPAARREGAPHRVRDTRAVGAGASLQPVSTLHGVVFDILVGRTGWRRPVPTLHGVVFDIFDSGARRAVPRSGGLRLAPRPWQPRRTGAGSNPPYVAWGCFRYFGGGTGRTRNPSPKPAKTGGLRPAPRVICPTGCAALRPSIPARKNIGFDFFHEYVYDLFHPVPLTRGVSRTSGTRDGLRWTRQRWAGKGL